MEEEEEEEDAACEHVTTNKGTYTHARTREPQTKKRDAINCDIDNVPSDPPVMRIVTSAVNSSGADDPAAMNVAPATSSLRPSASEMASRLSQK